MAPGGLFPGLNSAYVTHGYEYSESLVTSPCSIEYTIARDQSVNDVIHTSSGKITGSTLCQLAPRRQVGDRVPIFGALPRTQPPSPALNSVRAALAVPPVALVNRQPTRAKYMVTANILKRHLSQAGGFEALAAFWLQDTFSSQPSPTRAEPSG
jgi:hypothetical protein